MLTTTSKTIAQAGNQSIVLTRLGQDTPHYFTNNASITLTTENLRLSHDNAVINWNNIKQITLNGNATTVHYDWEGSTHILIVFGDMGELIEAVWLTQKTISPIVEEDFGKIVSGIENVICSTLQKTEERYTFKYDSFNTNVIVYEKGIKCYEYGQLKVQISFSSISKVSKLLPVVIMYYKNENGEELEIHVQEPKLYTLIYSMLPLGAVMAA